MEGGRAGVDEVLDELGDGRPGGPVGGEGGALLGGGDLSGQEEPEESLGKGLVASGSLGEELLALGDGLSSAAERDDKDKGQQRALDDCRREERDEPESDSLI